MPSPSTTIPYPILGAEIWEGDEPRTFHFLESVDSSLFAELPLRLNSLPMPSFAGCLDPIQWRRFPSLISASSIPLPKSQNLAPTYIACLKVGDPPPIHGWKWNHLSFWHFFLVVVFAPKLAIFPLESSVLGAWKGHFRGRKGQLVNSGFQDPKTTPIGRHVCRTKLSPKNVLKQ